LSFFDKIDKSMIVDAFKQFLNRTPLQNIFHGYPTNWYILQEYALLSVDVHENKTLTGQQKASTSMLNDNDQSRVYSQMQRHEGQVHMPQVSGSPKDSLVVTGSASEAGLP